MLFQLCRTPGKLRKTHRTSHLKHACKRPPTFRDRHVGLKHLGWEGGLTAVVAKERTAGT